MWKILEDIDARLTVLRDRAARAAQPRAADSRELLTVFQQEVSFLENDLSEQKVTFYNGDRDDIVIQRLGVTVSIELPNVVPSTRVTLFKVAGGWTTVTWLGGGNKNPGFDFMWNYGVNSRQSQYSRNPCMSDMLVGFDKGQMLDFRVPLVLPKSESVEFRVQPLRYLFPGAPGKVLGTTYFVAFVGLGYRSVP